MSVPAKIEGHFSLKKTRKFRGVLSGEILKWSMARGYDPAHAGVRCCRFKVSLQPAHILSRRGKVAGWKKREVSISRIRFFGPYKVRLRVERNKVNATPPHTVPHVFHTP